jgi:hypothetical protein
MAQAAVIPPRRRFFADMIDQFFAAHTDQQPEELLRIVQLILAQGRPHKEAREDRLTNVHRIQETAEARARQPNPGCPADLRFEEPYEFCGRRLVPGPDLGHQIPKSALLNHEHSFNGRQS